MCWSGLGLWPTCETTAPSNLKDKPSPVKHQHLLSWSVGRALAGPDFIPPSRGEPIFPTALQSLGGLGYYWAGWGGGGWSRLFTPNAALWLVEPEGEQRALGCARHGPARRPGPTKHRGGRGRSAVTSAAVGNIRRTVSSRSRPSVELRMPCVYHPNRAFSRVFRDRVLVQCLPSVFVFLLLWQWNEGVALKSELTAWVARSPHVAGAGESSHWRVSIIS